MPCAFPQTSLPEFFVFVDASADRRPTLWLRIRTGKSFHFSLLRKGPWLCSIRRTLGDVQTSLST